MSAPKNKDEPLYLIAGGGADGTAPPQAMLTAQPLRDLSKVSPAKLYLRVLLYNAGSRRL